MDIPINEAVFLLASKGLAIPSPEQTLEDIARKNHTSPLKLYMIVKPIEPKSASNDDGWTPTKVEKKYAGTGIGQKTLLEIAHSLNLDPPDLLSRLRSRDIASEPNETLKQVAQRNRLEPIELLKFILIKHYEVQGKNSAPHMNDVP
jgi:hypothetical protein